MAKIKCNTPNGVLLQLRGSEETVTIYGYRNAEEVQDGFGITDNVDDALWIKWVQENKNTDLYTSGAISAIEEA